MSESKPSGPTPPLDPEVHVAKRYSVDETNETNRQLVSDSYAEQPDNTNEQEMAVQEIRANAIANPAYHAAAAEAAAEAASQERTGRNFASPPDKQPGNAGVNENLREALAVPMPPGLEKPYDIPAIAPLTDKEKASFDKLIDAITATGSERYGYYAADQRAQARQRQTGKEEVTDQEHKYWVGTDKQPGKRQALATVLAEKLEANPEYLTIIQQRQQELADQVSDSGVTVTASKAKLAEMSGRSKQADEDYDDPDYSDMQAAIKDGSLAFNKDHKAYSSWYNKLPEESRVPIIGAALRGLAGMRPTQRKRAKFQKDRSNYAIGKGERDPYAKATGYAKTDPSRESEQWIIERAHRRSNAALHAGKAAMELETSNRIENKSRLRLQTLLEVTAAAEGMLGGESFMTRYGRPEMFENNATDTLSKAFENYSNVGAISPEDDHGMFAELLVMTDYVSRLDQQIEATDPDAKPTSFSQLVGLRSNMVGLLNRSRYRREQLRIATANTAGVSQAEGYFGQRGSLYVADKGIELDLSGVVIYEDGTVFDPSQNPQGHRSPNGQLSPPKRNEITHLPPTDHSDKSFDELRDGFEISLKNWFETQSDSPVRAHAASEYAIAAKEKALEIIAHDPENDEAYEIYNRAQYWVEYIHIDPGVSTASNEVKLKPNGSIEYESTTFNGLEGNWIIRPDGSMAMLLPRADGSKFVARRFASNGEALPIS